MTNTLLEKIASETQTLVSSLKQQSAAEVADIEAQTKRMIAELRDAAAHTLTKKKQHIERVLLAKAEQAAIMQLQVAKRESVNKLFSQVEENLHAEPSAQYIDRYQAKIKAVLATGETVTLVQGPVGRETETAAIMAACGINASSVFTSGITSGVIVTTDAGVYDMSLDRLLTDVRPELEIKLVTNA